MQMIIFGSSENKYLNSKYKLVKKGFTQENDYMKEVSSKSKLDDFIYLFCL
jgi:hypothetical protein